MREMIYTPSNLMFTMCLNSTPPYLAALLPRMI